MAWGRLRGLLRRFEFQYLLGTLKEVAARFPLSFSCCSAATALAILNVHDVKPLSDDAYDRLMLFFAYGVPFFAAARLQEEAAGARRLPAFAGAGLGGLALALACFAPAHFTALHFFLGGAVALAMLFAPYAGRKATDDSIWQFNCLNGIALAVAGVSTFVFCLGLCAVFGSLNYLIYDGKLSGDIYGDIWLFGMLFFGPVVFLRQVPRDFDIAKDACRIPLGVSFIANYLVVPLVLIYTWVLYVYFLKILAQWELPKGNLAYMVMGFGSFGTAARLAVFSLRETGTKLLQQFYRHFHLLLIVPLLLLAIGLYTRIAQYGVTEDRYAIGIGLAWLAAVDALFLLKPDKARLRHVPMILAALLLAASLGPWGVDSVSIRSQKARFAGLLAQAGVLQPDGTLVPAKKEVPFALRKEISGEMDYFSGIREPEIEPWVAPFRAAMKKKDNTVYPEPCAKFLNCWEGSGLVSRVMEAWGMAYVSQYATEEQGEYINLAAPEAAGGAAIMKTAPYAYLMNVTPYISGDSWTQDRVYREAGREVFRVKLTLTAAGDFTVALPDGRKAAFDLRALGREGRHRARRAATPDVPPEDFVLTRDSQGLKAQLHVLTLSGRWVGDRLALYSATLTLLISP